MSEQDLSMFKGRRQRKDGELGSYNRIRLMGDTLSQRWEKRGPTAQWWIWPQAEEGHRICGAGGHGLHASVFSGDRHERSTCV